MSYNKFLAKMASDQRKPDGLFVITPAMGPGFVETLPVGKFHGIGPATAAKMNQLGIVTGLDLKAQSLAFLQERFGKAGSYYHSIARGIDHRLVRADRIRKSIGAENTFAKDLTGFEEMKAEPSDPRQGLAPLRAHGRPWPHRHPEGEVHRFRADHTSPLAER